jgi:hypothetical protein
LRTGADLLRRSAAAFTASAGAAVPAMSDGAVGPVWRAGKIEQKWDTNRAVTAIHASQGQGCEQPGHQAVVTWPPWIATVATGVPSSSHIV